MAPQPNSSNSPSTLSLSNQIVSKFKPAKIFRGAVEAAPQPSPGTYARQNTGPRHITGLSFDDQGTQLITAAEDETFRLYNCKTEQ